MQRILEYLKRNEWIWFPLVMTIVICGTVLICIASTLPTNIHYYKESEATQQETLLTKKQFLVETIYNTAGQLCENSKTGEFSSQCLSEVTRQVEASVAKVK